MAMYCLYFRNGENTLQSAEKWLCTVCILGMAKRLCNQLKNGYVLCEFLEWQKYAAIS
jgi:hypothetical protein